MITAKIPDELWLFVARHLELQDMLNLCRCEAAFYPLLEPRLKLEFARLCPWYLEEVTLQALYRYFEPGTISVTNLLYQEVDKSLPDDFESFLGGQRNYQKRSFSHYCFELDKHKKKKLLKAIYNDRGIQVGDRLVYLSEKRLPWNKGARLVLEAGGTFKVDKVSCTMAPNMYSQDYSVYLTDQLVVVESEISDRDCLGYVVKRISGKSASHTKPDMVMTTPHPLSFRKSFTIISGSHIFYERTEIVPGDRSIYYVNGNVELRLPKSVASSTDYMVRSLATYKGKFYLYLSNEYLIENSYLEHGKELHTKVLGHFPGYKVMRQDERYPRYMFSVPYDTAPMIIMDMEDLVMYETFYEEDCYPMPGISDGKLKCYSFSDDYIKARWKVTRPAEEHEYVL
ncbi:hypothetical protein CJU90_6598 [Yarrowia sp. C11]|nr:hypothetical protein CJU90_6598 [Yarrowia sp. C11]KAG5358710.1 hypothetical protein CKK34_4975 [Yarrowia sp. E02]